MLNSQAPVNAVQWLPQASLSLRGVFRYADQFAAVTNYRVSNIQDIALSMQNPGLAPDPYRFYANSRPGVGWTIVAAGGWYVREVLGYRGQPETGRLLANDGVYGQQVALDYWFQLYRPDLAPGEGSTRLEGSEFVVPVYIQAKYTGKFVQLRGNQLWATASSLNEATLFEFRSAMP